MRMGQGKTQFSAGGEPINRERILRAAVAAFGEHGYEGASTNQICADAGISKGLLFHYFKSKENLFMEVLERCRAEVAAAMEPVDASVPEEPLTALNNFYQRQLDFFSSHPHHYRIMVQLPQGHSALLEEFFRKERARFENALSLGLRLYLSRSPVRAGIDREMVLELVTDLVIHLQEKYLSPAVMLDIPLEERMRMMQKEMAMALEVISYGILEPGQKERDSNEGRA